MNIFSLSNKLLKSGLILLLIAFFSVKSMATHNRSGEITYTHIAGFTYEFTITTYTKSSSIDADRPILGINWGDGNVDSIPRTQEVFLPNDIKANKYTARHTYSGPFTYIVSMGDPNRIDGILNIGNSVNALFFLEDTVKILNPNFFGFNSSPQLLYPPLDYGNVDIPFIHNPNAFDPDGDSLYYEIVPPKGGPGIDVPDYFSPTLIRPGPNNQISINSKTGELIWDAPQQQGIYNVAILVKEYRNGIFLGSVLRDLQIIIEANNNKPPKIDEIDQLCLIAGDTLDFIVRANDPDIGQVVTLSAAGAPLSSVNNPASFVASSPGNPTSGRFVWRTNCNNLRNTDYVVIFRAVDNFSPPLSDVKTINIRLLAPPPKNISGVYTRSTNSIRLTWQNPYVCSSNEKFKNFSVWRKKGCGMPLDSCSVDLISLGYERIGFTTNYFFVDQNMEFGNDYSYRIKAEFTDKSSGGVEFNPFSGFPSDEFCLKLPLDIPVIYNVDVKSTDIANGSIYIEWSKPNAEDLDTVFNPGPYKFILYRTEGMNGIVFTKIEEKNAAKFSDIIDTSFLDLGLNTTDNSYAYKVDFIVNGSDTLGTTSVASSIFLNLIPSDKTIELNWNYNVPWVNDSFRIYRRTENDLNFNLIKVVSTSSYRDENLNRDSIYCYKIEGIGAYTNLSLKRPLLNFSQENCAQPKDTVAPCPPILTVRNFCNDDNIPSDDFTNYLNWKLDANCQETDTIVKFNVYFSETVDGVFELIASINDINIDSFKHDLNIQKSLAGCYVVTAFDNLGNESTKSNFVCVENCPIYELPNAFTPNGDGSNDLYTPIIPYQFVNRIEMEIFNQWGDKVFETADPDINWDGTDFKNQKELEAGVYYYVCEVYFASSNGETKLANPLKGFIHLFREK